MCFHHPYRIGAAAAAACCGPIDCMLVLGFLLCCLPAASAACHFRCVSPGLRLNEARRMHESVCARSHALGNGAYTLETKKRTTNFPIMFLVRANRDVPHNPIRAVTLFRRRAIVSPASCQQQQRRHTQRLRSDQSVVEYCTSILSVPLPLPETFRPTSAK